MEDVPEDKRFWVCDGSTIKNLEELANALKKMDDDIFRHHSNESKNDFYNWIRDVIGDEKLANIIRDKDRFTTSSIISERLRRKNRCPYVSPMLECFIGGDAHLGCMHPSFHDNCAIKSSFESNEKLRKSLNTSR